MAKKLPTILSLSAALAALPGVATTLPAPADAATNPEQADMAATKPSSPRRANVIFSTGKDLLGLIVTTTADGTVVAQHDSHYSHSSHASHRSHYSAIM